MHPGGLVRGYTPPAPPGPPPTGKQYLWAVSNAADGWSVPAVGATGPIKHSSGYCINGQTKQGTEFEVAECTGAAIQDFVLEANGNVHMAGGAQYCLAVKSSGMGPAVISFKCTSNGNEEMVFTPSAGGGDGDGSSTGVEGGNGSDGGGGVSGGSGGKICDKNTGTDNRCLDIKPTNPSSSGSVGASVQIWAKPQPNGGVAVLVLNAANDDNVTVPFNFSEIRYTGGATGGATSVLDIWTGKTTPVAAGATAYTSDAIAPHDSRFYLFSKV